MPRNKQCCDQPNIVLYSFCRCSKVSIEGIAPCGIIVLGTHFLVVQHTCFFIQQLFKLSALVAFAVSNKLFTLTNKLSPFQATMPFKFYCIMNLVIHVLLIWIHLCSVKSINAHSIHFVSDYSWIRIQSASSVKRPSH